MVTCNSKTPKQGQCDWRYWCNTVVHFYLHFVRNAKTLNVTSCSSEKKAALYEISNTSFSLQNHSANSFYNLIKSFLGKRAYHQSFCFYSSHKTTFYFTVFLCTLIGGAPLADVVRLSSLNISMDVDTLRSLDSNVITVRTITKELNTEWNLDTFLVASCC